MEIENINIIKLREVMLEDKSIYMVFEYAEHDFLVSPHLAAIPCIFFTPYSSKLSTTTRPSSVPPSQSQSSNPFYSSLSTEFSTSIINT